MKIYAGWYAACAILCVYAHPARDRANEMYITSSRSYDPKSTADSYDFEEQLSATKLFEILEDSQEFEEQKSSSTMRAIVTRAHPVLLPLIIEPEAEMLPAGYKGVKPPGVTHMELAKPQTDPSGRKSATLRASTTDDDSSGKSGEYDQDNDAHYAASKHETQVARDDRGTSNLFIFEVGSKGDRRKENEKAEYTEVSGASKSRSVNEDRAKNHKEEVMKKKGTTTYKTGDDSKKTHNTAGYHNIYHKDELKKDADFYNNGRQGGRFENHSRYGEKYAIAEGTYAKGKNNDSRFVEKEANQQKKFEKMREPRSPRSRYDGFLLGT